MFLPDLWRRSKDIGLLSDACDFFIADFRRCRAVQDVREIPNIDEIKKNIRKYFDDYCAAYGIDDMRSQRQPVFNGAMQYIYNNYIRPSNVLKRYTPKRSG